MFLLLLLAAVGAPVELCAAAQPQNGSLRIDTPNGSSSLYGTTNITLALNNLWINTVQYKVDGQPISPQVIYPYTFSWDTNGVTDGPHTLTGVGVDDAGIEYASPPVELRVNNARTPEAQNGSLRIVGLTGGARVFGAADLSLALNNLWINTVQFTVDGQPVGGPVGFPYTFSWNTAGVSDGWHTLAAVAVDDARFEYAAPPITVRVDNVAPAPAPVLRYEETAATYGPGWTPRLYWDWLRWSGGQGSAMETTTAGAQASFAFNGTSITWIGYRGVNGGIARVSVDGHFIADVDTFGRRDYNMTQVYNVGGLAPGDHTITIEATGEKNIDSFSNLVLIDAFETPGQVVSQLQESDPAIAWSAGWLVVDSSQKPWAGGFASISSTPGDVATFTFTGSEIRWISYHGPESGIAKVYIDGTFVREVDGYAAHPQFQDILFEATNLAAGVLHTITIENTGRKNPAISGTAYTVIDAFNVTRTGSVERYQQDEWAVHYNGDWVLNNNKAWSEGTSMAAYYPGLTATFKFNGTGVAWIGFRAGRTGIAQVYVDGVRYPDVDTYVPGTSEGWQDTVFKVSGLPSGPHTLLIKVDGEKNPNATNAYIVVDAFDVER